MNRTFKTEKGFITFLDSIKDSLKSNFHYYNGYRMNGRLSFIFNCEGMDECYNVYINNNELESKLHQLHIDKVDLIKHYKLRRQDKIASILEHGE